MGNGRSLPVDLFHGVGPLHLIRQIEDTARYLGV